MFFAWSFWIQGESETDLSLRGSEGESKISSYYPTDMQIFMEVYFTCSKTGMQ